MARLTTKKRDRLPSSEFGFPTRIHTGKRGAKVTRDAYPIDTKPRARSALARAARYESHGNQVKLAEKIHRRFPGMVIKLLGMTRRKRGG